MRSLRFLGRAIRSAAEATITAPATQTETDEIVVYGTAWCGDCWRTKRFLDRHQVRYRWVDVDRDHTALERVTAIDRGRRSVPTLVFPDGSTLTEPSDAELGRKLGVDRRG